MLKRPESSDNILTTDNGSNLLDAIFLAYGTDKSSSINNYAQAYHPALSPFRHDIRKVVEIGIFGTTPDNAGASLKSWADYFPNAHIYGVDLFDYSFLQNDRITTIIADQSVIQNQLDQVASVVGNDIDLIIDDGGHEMQQQQIALGYLFRLLKPGGCYIIEDLQTSYSNTFNPTGTQFNTMVMLEILHHTGIVQSDHISESDRQYIQQHLASCEIHKIIPFRSETALLWKRNTRI